MNQFLVTSPAWLILISVASSTETTKRLVIRVTVRNKNYYHLKFVATCANNFQFMATRFQLIIKYNNKVTSIISDSFCNNFTVSGKLMYLVQSSSKSVLPSGSTRTISIIPKRLAFASVVSVDSATSVSASFSEVSDNSRFHFCLWFRCYFNINRSCCHSFNSLT